MQSLTALQDRIIARRLALSLHRALLVGISGIDGSGKSFLTAGLAKRLRRVGWSVVPLSVDDWHNLPSVRFSETTPAEQFYEHGLRLDDMFQQVVIPLRDQCAIEAVTDYADAKSLAYKKDPYCFSDVTIILLEGIFLFKAAYRSYFDLKVWIDCSFETALERAVQRAQEGLVAAETIEAFQRIYFPAQRLHSARDEPRSHADVVFVNDRAMARPRCVS